MGTVRRPEGICVTGGPASIDVTSVTSGASIPAVDGVTVPFVIGSALVADRVGFSRVRGYVAVVSFFPRRCCPLRLRRSLTHLRVPVVFAPFSLRVSRQLVRKMNMAAVGLRRHDRGTPDFLRLPSVGQRCAVPQIALGRAHLRLAIAFVCVVLRNVLYG